MSPFLAKPTCNYFMQSRLSCSVKLVFLSLFVVATASAQEINLSSAKKSSSSISPDSVQWMHITPQLMNSEAGKTAIAEYHYLKENGLLPAPKNGQQPIGEKKNFSVLNIRTNTESPIEFTLMAEGTKFNLWVETTQLVARGGRVTASDIAALAQAIGLQTPSGSIDPSKGIVAIDEMVFGPPSDVDGSGKMDVLLHDIQDFYDPDNAVFSAVGGFFYPKDLQIPNRQDIIHLDTVPGMYTKSGVPKSQTDLHQTLAHEYEHLIMQANKGTETSFISEGMAEWAEVVNGYTPRAITYLNSSFERSRSLLSFREDQPYGGPDSEDYQRGGLWTNYLADRLGYATVGRIARTNGSGYTTYVGWLTSPAVNIPVSILEDYLQGFHVANLINDASAIPNFGYTTPSRKAIRVSGIPEIDGKTAVGTTKSGTVGPGAVVYQKWTDVGSFNLTMTVTNQAFRTDLKPILIFDAANGARSFAELSPGGEGVQKAGNFTSVQLVIPHVDLSSSQTVSFNYEATWSPYTGTASFENVVYDNGTVHHEVSGNSILIIGDSVPSASGGAFAATDKFANKFTVPAGAALVETSVSMMFISDLNPSATNSSVKDFRLSVWNDNAGKPGSALVSDVFTYTGGSTAPTLGFQTISLLPYQNILKTASGTIYVSIENAGTDNNYMYFITAYAPNQTTSPSFMFNRFGTSAQRWASFDALTSQGQPAFPGQVLPIRGRIDLNAGSTSNAVDVELPQFISLDQNYPNPFNPTTSIQFSNPTAALVKLNVYDLLGRNVATLKNGVMMPGTHSIQFDASRLNSGLYLYTLQVGSQKLTRTMTLIK